MLTIGAILFLQGRAQATGEKPNAVLQGIGISVLSTGITGVVLLGYIILSDTYRNRIQVIQNFGIHDYFDSNTTPIRGEYTSRLSKKSKNIDILGLGLNNLRKDFGDSLAGWAANGIVRILLVDPDYPTAKNSLADMRDVEESDSKGTIRGEVSQWLTETKNLRQANATTFQVRLYRCLPTVTMVRIDGELFWAPYLMKRSSSSTPTMLVNRGGLLFSVVTDHFDQIWNSNDLSRPAP